MTLEESAAVLLVVLLACPGPVAPGLAQEAKLPPEQALKAKLLEIPTGSVVEVKLRGKPKVRGKLGALQDSGFEVQSMRNGKVVTDTLSFAEVKSVSYKQGMGTATKVLAGIGIGCVVLVVISLIAAAATGGFNN
jgi:hypothetical protein